jgi:hypothetical protein
MLYPDVLAVHLLVRSAGVTHTSPYVGDDQFVISPRLLCDLVTPHNIIGLTIAEAICRVITHVLKDIELQCREKICILLKFQRCAMNDFFFANFRLDFEGRYVADYGQTFAECQVGT